MSTVSEPFKGIVCLSIYLREVPCEKEPDPADTVMNVLREWPFFFTS